MVPFGIVGLGGCEQTVLRAPTGKQSNTIREVTEGKALAIHRSMSLREKGFM